MSGKKQKLIRAIARKMTTVFEQKYVTQEHKRRVDTGKKNEKTGKPVYAIITKLTHFHAPGTYRACINICKRLYRRGLLLNTKAQMNRRLAYAY